MGRPPRALIFQSRLFGVVNDMRVDAFNQSMLDAFFHRPAAPFGRRLFLGRIGTFIAFGKRDQPFGLAFKGAIRRQGPVENNILARVAQFGVDGVVHIQLAGVDNRHV